MSNVNLINYSTREFTTKGEMDSYIRKQDEIFTPEVTKIFIGYLVDYQKIKIRLI